jgi:hypothetical protein
MGLQIPKCDHQILAAGKRLVCRRVGPRASILALHRNLRRPRLNLPFPGAPEQMPSLNLNSSQFLQYDRSLPNSPLS